jgi:hypothetical protein
VGDARDGAGVSRSIFPDGFAVRICSESDFVYVMALQRANRESVGGLPGPALRERIAKRAALLGLLNGDPQACIQYDARRRAYGAALVGAALLDFDGEEIRVRCAADLEANLFWRDLGFTCTATTPGGKRRGRTLNLWQKWLTPRLIGADEIAVAPVAQRREDSMYDETDYLLSTPDGFADGGSLGKLAWSNRRST